MGVDMLRVASLIGVLASPALADAVVVSNCQIQEGGIATHHLECDVENISDTAIKILNHTVQIFQTGRTVPWAHIGSESRPGTTGVAGGIEPGETRNLILGFFDIFEEVPIDELYAEVTVLPPQDVNGVPITD